METYTVWTLLSAGLRIMVLACVILWVGPITSLSIYWWRKHHALKKTRAITARRMEEL